MKHPAQIVVGPVVYTVSSKPSDVDAAIVAAVKSQGQPDFYGVTNHPNLTITLNPEQADGQLRDTVLHEVLHTVTTIASLELSGKEEEEFVSRISPILLDVLRRNPALVEYLTAP